MWLKDSKRVYIHVWYYQTVLITESSFIHASSISTLVYACVYSRDGQHSDSESQLKYENYQEQEPKYIRYSGTPVIRIDLCSDTSGKAEIRIIRQ